MTLERNIMAYYDPTVYNKPEWFESLKWQHRWINFMIGWWVGTFGCPRHVIDFGAGDGWWCKAFKDIGAEHTYAVELYPLAKEYIPPEVQFVCGDLRERLELGGRTDLVMCLEVAEHLPAKYEDALLGNIVRHASDKILFSAATPDQPGTGHVNLRPHEYWRQRIRQRGKIEYAAEMTEQVRQAWYRILPEPFHFLPRNIQVFARI